MDTWADLGRLRAPLSTPMLVDALAGARADIDALLWRRDVRTAAAAVAAASLDRGGRASAAIDGADVVDADASPMGRVLARAWAVTSAATAQVSTWERAPLQVIAHLHAVAAAGFQDTDDLGRPRSTEDADDPLRIGMLAPVESLSPRLVALAGLMVRSDDLPGIAMAALAHHEVMALRPFGWGSGLVARALTRCVLASRGLDPSCFSIPEVGMLEQGRGSYVRAMRGYLDGTTEGLVDSLVWFCACVGLGARAVQVPSA